MRRAFQKALCISVAATLALAGCRTTKDYEGVDVPPTKYADFDCEQLHAEAQRIQPRYVELEAQLDEELRRSDTAFWSTAFIPLVNSLYGVFVDVPVEIARGKRVREFKRLKGERQAILKAAAEKRCPRAEQQLTTGNAGTVPPKASDEQTTAPIPPK
jgi:hypothetical protein